MSASDEDKNVQQGVWVREIYDDHFLWLILEWSRGSQLECLMLWRESLGWEKNTSLKALIGKLELDYFQEQKKLL